jgi:hypothetical protein
MTPTATKAAVPGAMELSDSLACFRRALPIKRGWAAPKTMAAKTRLAGGETGKDISGGPLVRKEAHFNVENHVSTSLRA